MIRHCSLFKFKPDVGPEMISKIMEEFSKLPGLIQAIESFEIGKNVGDRPDNYDIGVCMTFASFEAYKVYRVNPDHIKFYQEFLIPFQDARTSVQFEIE
jgi:hypothetical protein